MHRKDMQVRDSDYGQYQSSLMLLASAIVEIIFHKSVRLVHPHHRSRLVLQTSLNSKFSA
jgi:hypothetical protein